MLFTDHRIITSQNNPELEGTQKHHQVQLLALHRTTQKSKHISKRVAQILQWA